MNNATLCTTGGAVTMPMACIASVQVSSASPFLAFTNERALTLDELRPRLAISVNTQRGNVQAASLSNPITGIPDTITFENLIESWHKERGASSSTREITTCQSYLAIIGMGRDALPLIFERLRAEGEKPDHWFAALRAITRDNPVQPQNRGNLREMAKAWLNWWASKSGYGG